MRNGFGVPLVNLRFFNVYGPRQPQTGAYALVLGIFLNRHAQNKVLEIHGGGTQRRDFVHVIEDLIFAAHRPDKSIIPSPASRVNRPPRRQRRLHPSSPSARQLWPPDRR